MPGAAAREGADEPVRTSRAGEYSFSRSDRWMAWTKRPRSRPARRQVWAKREGGNAFKVNNSGNAVAGNVAGRRLVFQKYRGEAPRGSSSIKIINLRNRNLTSPPAVNTRHWEYWPKMSKKWLLFVRLNVNTGKRTLLLRNMRANNTRVLSSGGPRTYFQPGQVNGKWAVWLVWRPGQRTKAIRLNIPRNSQRKVPNGGRFNWAPSVTPRGTVYFGRSGRRCGSNFRLLRWKPGQGVGIVKRFKLGNDMSDSFVYRTPQGRLQVFHNKVRCGPRRSLTSNVYRFTDPWTTSLRVTKEGSGSGVVKSRPPGIRCGRDCRQYFERGTRVTLIADPRQGSEVQRWSLDRCGSRRRCTVRVTDDAKVVTVRFRP